MRGSSTPRLLGSIIAVSGILDPRLRGDENQICVDDLATWLPELCIVCCPHEIRGRREDRVLPAPAVSRAVCAMARAAHEHTGTGGASRPSLRNGLTAYIVLSPENGSFASVISETLSPLADLMPAPRHQDHTTSPYASGAHVARASSVHRIPPRVRDVRERPLIG